VLVDEGLEDGFEGLGGLGERGAGEEEEREEVGFHGKGNFFVIVIILVLVLLCLEEAVTPKD
jgi:hypothetical protein